MMRTEQATLAGHGAAVTRPASPKARPDAVVLLQGIARTRFSLGRMARGLAAAGLETYNLGGPSPRLRLEAQVERFRRDLEGLAREIRGDDGAPRRLHGVGHSLGGIVLRVALAQAEGVIPGRLVAIGAPFLGLHVANVVARYRAARLVLGPAIEDLVWQGPALRRLARVAQAGCDMPEVGIVLSRCGFQPLIPASWINAWLGIARNTDGTVEIESARGDDLWPPPADVVDVGFGHTFMAAQPEVVRQTAHFLSHGRFAPGP